MSNLSKHILVIRLSAMGDVAMTVPVLRALTEQYPKIKLTVLTKPHLKPFFRDLRNTSIHSAEIRVEHKGVFGLWKLSRELKPLGIDAVADLHNVLRSNILKWFFPKPIIQIDKGRTEKKALTKGEKHEQLKTTHQRYAEVFERLGFSIDLSNPKFPEPKTISKKALTVTGVKNSKWIGIAPFAAHKGKAYPLDKMKNVIETLSKEHKVLLFGGGKGEVAKLNSFASNNPKIVNIAGQLSLDLELDVISNLDVMLSMDSGNGHIAAMLGIPVVTIWGVTHPFSGFAPFNQPESHQLLADRDRFPLIPTSVYGNKYPGDYENAAGSISEDVIITKIRQII